MVARDNRAIIARASRRTCRRAPFLGQCKINYSHVIEQVDDVTASGGKRKRTLGKTNATDLLDDVEDDMPCTDIFQCDPGLTCASTIEMDF